MYPFNPRDPETERRQALARIYALLIRLSEEGERQADPQSFQTKEAQNENQEKESDDIYSRLL